MSEGSSFAGNDPTTEGDALSFRVSALPRWERERICATMNKDLDLLAILMTAEATSKEVVKEALNELTTLVTLLSHDRYLKARRELGLSRLMMNSMSMRVFPLYADEVRERLERVMTERDPRHLMELERFMVATRGGLGD